VLLVVLRFFIILQILLFCVFLDKLITMEVSDIFWPFWIALSLLVSLSIGSGAFFLNKVLSNLFKKSKSDESKQSNKLVYCSLWMTYIVLGFTILMTFLVIGARDFLEDNNNSNRLVTWLGVAFIYSIFGIILTFSVKEYIV